MGNYNITISGVGAHHSAETNPDDANVLAAEFVELLKARGHKVTVASFVQVCHEDISDPDAYLKKYAPE